MTTDYGRDATCPGVRRSVDIEARGEPLILLIGGVKVDRLKIPVLRIWPFQVAVVIHKRRPLRSGGRSAD